VIKLEIPNRLHCLDADKWEEIPDRTIGTTGNVYVGRDYIPKEGKEQYQVRVFVKKIEHEK